LFKKFSLKYQKTDAGYLKMVASIFSFGCLEVMRFRSLAAISAEFQAKTLKFDQCSSLFEALSLIFELFFQILILK